MHGACHIPFLAGIQQRRERELSSADTGLWQCLLSSRYRLDTVTLATITLWARFWETVHTDYTKRNNERDRSRRQNRTPISIPIRSYPRSLGLLILVLLRCSRGNRNSSHGDDFWGRGYGYEDRLCGVRGF